MDITSHLGQRSLLENHLERRLLSQRPAKDGPIPRQFLTKSPCITNIPKDPIQQVFPILRRHVDHPRPIDVSGSLLKGEFGAFFLGGVSVAFVDEGVGAELGIVDEIAFGDSAMRSDVVLMIRRRFNAFHSVFHLHSPAKIHISLRVVS